MTQKYSMAERETDIVWDDDTKVAEIYTASPITIKKLNKLCDAYPNVYVRTWTEDGSDGQITAAKYRVPCSYIRFGKPATEAMREKGRRLAEHNKTSREMYM